MNYAQERLDLDQLLHPSQAFDHTSEVVADADLTVGQAVLVRAGAICTGQVIPRVASVQGRGPEMMPQPDLSCSQTPVAQRLGRGQARTVWTCKRCGATKRSDEMGDPGTLDPSGGEPSI